MTLGEAFCSKRYGRSSWIAVGLVFFVFMNGYYAINVFANQIFHLIKEVKPTFVEPREATYAFFGFTVLGSIFSFSVVMRLGRKTVMLLGTFLDFCALSLAAGAMFFNATTLATIFIFLFSFFYASTLIAIFMTHIAETNPDVTLGIAAICTSTFVMFDTISFFPLETAFGVGSFFLFCAIFAFLSFIYVLFVIRESKGLTDKECKTLYQPKVEGGYPLSPDTTVEESYHGRK